jgi:hypothetical protein
MNYKMLLVSTEKLCHKPSNMAVTGNLKNCPALTEIMLASIIAHISILTFIEMKQSQLQT